jgi:hypothetical protein
MLDRPARKPHRHGRTAWRAHMKYRRDGATAAFIHDFQSQRGSVTPRVNGALILFIKTLIMDQSSG